MARHWRQFRARNADPSENRAIVLALLLALLIGWNAFDWVQPIASSPVPLAGQPADGIAASPPDTSSRDLVSASTPDTTSGDGVSVSTPDTASASFGICGGGARYTCVVDGDTFWLDGQKIRISDIDTPEVFSPRCPAELERGRLATERLTGLLNAGPFALEQNGRAQDRYGRALYRVTRGGESIGSALVDEGLAVWYGNGRPDWC